MAGNKGCRDFMGDMPSARVHALFDLRRKRAGIATMVVLVAAVASVLLTQRTELMALAVAALLARFAVPSWVGVQPQFPVPSMGAAVRDHLLSFGVPMSGVLVLYMVLNKGNLYFLGMIPPVVLAAGIYSVYQWRYLGVALARLRGDDTEMSFGDRLWRHYLGYAAGLAAGGLAGSLGAAYAADGNALLAQGLFAVGFLGLKALVDIAFPQPPLKAERASIATLQLAAMSPIWFGLPWGAALTGLAAFTTARYMPLTMAVADEAIIIVYVTIASIVVFTAIAVVAFVLELSAGEN